MIELPPSKSIGARYMVAAYFAGTLPGDPFFEDNEDLMTIQQALLEIYSDEEPIDYGDTPLDVGASGTALRFVTAVCASTPGADYVITGTQRLMERPMKQLSEVLRQAGAEIESLGGDDKGPYRVKGNQLEGGEFSIRGDISSQFISAVMLAAPSWTKGIKLNFSTPLVSGPYVEMTAGLMEKFGVKAKLTSERVEVPNGKYVEPEGFTVEADWSSASFFYEASAIGVKGIDIARLVPPEKSLQGDAKAAELFESLGVVTTFAKEGASLTLREIPGKHVEIDFKDFPDLLLPFAVACLLNDIKFIFTNVAHLRLKESDRLESLKEEAEKIGFKLNVGEDSIEWNGETCGKEENPLIRTHDDHRVAMTFAVAAAKFGKLRIENPRVVEKSFIDFWNQIRSLGFKTEDGEGFVTVSYEQA